MRGHGHPLAQMMLTGIGLRPQRSDPKASSVLRRVPPHLQQQLATCSAAANNAVEEITIWMCLLYVFYFI